MPPKRGSRGHGGVGQTPFSFSSHGGASGSSSSRRNFSIATFFDAASASASGRRAGGTGFRLGTGDPPATLSQMASALRDTTEGRGSGGRHAFRSGENEEGSGGHEGMGTGFSATLLEVRSRILAEIAAEHEATSSSAGRGRRPGVGPSRLHQHRQRALRIAFGEKEGRLSDGGATSTGQGPSSQSPQRFSNHPRSSLAGGGNEDEEDDGLMVSSVEFSLLCPYSRLPMTHPVRSRDCRHVQCCDLESWMVLLDKCRSMRDPKGPCPVCEQRVAASSLEADFWMMNVMEQMPPGTRLVELDADGSYRNGDLTRERRKELMTTEIIDATQEDDCENYLGDVVDDEDCDTLASPPPHRGLLPKEKRRRSPSLTALDPSPEDDSTARRAANSAAASTSSPTLMSVKRERFMQQQQQQQQQPPEQPQHQPAPTAHSTHGSNHRDQVDTVPQGPAPPLEPPPPSSVSHEEPAPSQDPGVAIVYYVEGTAARPLPSQVRRWLSYCPACQTPLLKGEDGQLEACRSCGQTTREHWTLVRRFEESSAVSMELTPDDTLVLRGVDAAAAYLFRAGFQRSPFGATTEPAGSGLAAGLWTTSTPLTRVELDFLEACCQRIARGEDVEDLGTTAPVPPLFRIPRRRKAGANGAPHGGQRSFGATQPQPSLGAASSQSRGYGSGVASANSATGLSQHRQGPSPNYPLFATR